MRIIRQLVEADTEIILNINKGFISGFSSEDNVRSEFLNNPNNHFVACLKIIVFLVLHTAMS